MKQPDERYVLHRYKATSHAAMVGAGLMVAWFLYNWFVRGIHRTDILAIMIAMAITKLGFLLYFNRTD